MNLAQIDQAAAAAGLRVLGGVDRPDGHPLPPGHARTLLLFGPREPDFWTDFARSPEAQDGAPDPLNRWSVRVIGRLAAAFEAEPLFPFGGPPWLPFVKWALQSGRCHTSPVAMLVHVEVGLFLSFRGAIAFGRPVEVPPPAPSPCDSCDGKPCLTACPVEALSPSGLDAPRCHAFLDTAAGATCMSTGCAARRACPVGAGLRLPEQSAFHMAAYHP